MITVQQAARLLQENDRFEVLLHAYPDGDTIGSGYALCRALRLLGKQANVRCAHPVPPAYAYITDPYTHQDFEPAFFVSTDVASLSLLGPGGTDYAGKIELAIDHHGTHERFAAHSLVQADAASCAEVVLAVLDALAVPVDAYLANCLYTGISTDTGCFKYTNTTAACHLAAARMMQAGADIEQINQAMFDTKSRARIAIERAILEGMEFFADGKIAFITITNRMRQETHAEEGDLEGITSLPRQVEGVLIGCTLRENEQGEYRVSVRSRSPISSAAICAQFGGGGHTGAAGCRFTCDLATAKQQLLAACTAALSQAQ